MHAETQEAHHDSHNKHHHHPANNKGDKELKENFDSGMKMLPQSFKSASRSRAHIARSSAPSPSVSALVEVFPSKAPSQKAGMVDASTPKNGEAHIIKTPGPDKTIVNVNAQGMNAKVNLPAQDPVRDSAKGEAKDGEQTFNNGSKNLVGLGNARPLDGITDDGKGGPQGLEVSPACLSSHRRSH